MKKVNLYKSVCEKEWKSERSKQKEKRKRFFLKKKERKEQKNEEKRNDKGKCEKYIFSKKEM